MTIGNARPRYYLSYLTAVLACSSLVFGPFSSAIGALINEDDPAAVSVQVNVVNVLATVRDKKGALVSGLEKDDFALSDDGNPETIRYFTRETNLPLTLGLLVDTSLSQRRVLDQERSASGSFLERVLREDRDKAFIIHFDREVELVQDLTSSRQKLEEALVSLQTPQLTRASGGNSGSDPDDRRDAGGRHHQGGGTLLYDAVYLASDELMKKQPGRKALVILSDGVDRGSKETLEVAMESAQRADTIVYSILFKDDQAYEGGHNRIGYGIPGIGGPGMGGPGMGGGRGRHGGGGPQYPQESHPDGKKILERISRETGGRLFEVSKKMPVDQIYAQIEEELRSQYNLGYTPSRTEAEVPAYHKIQLTTRRKDLVVQARDGYYLGAGH